MFRGSRGASDARFSKVAAARRGSRATTLRFGVGARDAIAVRVHAPLAEAQRPTPVALHSRDLSEVYADTVFVSNAVGEYVAAEHLTRRRALSTAVRGGAHPRGNRRGETRVRLGGRARPRVPTARRDTQTVGADRAAGAVHDPGGRGDATGRDAAFAALVRAMATRRVVAVVAFARVGERDAGARCAALVPAETEDGAHHGLHVVYLPFADDVRYRARDAREHASRRRRRRGLPRRDGGADSRGGAGCGRARGALVRSVGHLQPDARAASSRVGVAGAEPRVDRGRRRRGRRDGTAGGGRLAALARANPWRRSRRRRTARITTRRWRRRWRRRAREEPNGKPRWAAV